MKRQRKHLDAPLRLQDKDWIKTEWGVQENNRRAKFYSIHPLRTETTGVAS